MFEENDNKGLGGEQIFDNPLSHEFLSVEQFAKWCGVSVRTVILWSADKRIKVHPIGKKHKVLHLSEIREAIIQNRLALPDKESNENENEKHGPSGYKPRRDKEIRGKDKMARSFNIEKIRRSKAGS